MQIEGWDSKQQQIKASYQFILFKLKVYEMFECADYAAEKVFFDLMRYPNSQWRFFP